MALVPRFTSGHRELAQVYMRMGKLPEARRTLEKGSSWTRATRRFSRHWDSCSTAAATFPPRAARSSGPRPPRRATPRLRLALSAVYRDEGRKDAALTELLEAGRIWPKDGDVQNALGVMLLDAGRTQEAATAFEAALQARAKDPDALFNLARVRLAQGDPQQAGVLLERLLAAKPDYPGAAQMLEHAREQAPAGLELRLMRVDSRERAEEALRRIAAGADFAELARQWSNDPTAQAGGDLGAVRPEDLAEPLRGAAARLAVGELERARSNAGGLGAAQARTLKGEWPSRPGAS